MSPPADGGRLRKELGLYDVYAISTGAMFSSGFFLLPGLAAAKTGPSVGLAYLVAGLFILPAMFAVAELATAMPRAGGAYYFLDRSLGPLVGTVGGLGTWVALVLKSAFALAGMGAYLALYVDVPIVPVAVALTVFFALVNVVGAKESGRMQGILVMALLAVLVLFIIHGLVAVGSGGPDDAVRQRFTPFFAFGASGFMATVGFVFVSYAGLTKVASVSEEVRNPDRNIPLGMMLSLLTAAVVYTVGVFIIVAVLPSGTLRNDLTPVATAAASFVDWIPPGWGVALIVVAATAAFASTGNAGVLSASRYPLAMARDRLVPDRFARLGRFRTPTAAIVATAAAMAAAIVLLDIEGIAKLASAFQLLLFSLLCLAVVIMRESRIVGYDPGFRSPLYPWLQIAGVLAPLWLIAEMGQMAILFTLGLVAVTVAWYFKYALPRVERTGAIYHAFARLGERRYGGLDIELRGIVKEKGLRAEDPYDEVVARAAVLELAAPIPFEELLALVSDRLAAETGLDPDLLRSGFTEELEAGFVPVAHGAALPHLRVSGLTRPRIVLARSRSALRLGGGIPDPAAQPPVHAVVFLLSPEEEPGQHLRLLGHLATHVDDPAFLSTWLEAAGPDELRATLLREERSLTVRVGVDPATEEWAGRALREVRLPPDSLVALVRRNGHGIIPNGGTVLHRGDHLTVIGEPDAIRALAGRNGRVAGEAAVGD